jgi:hypothetical protein
MPPRTVGVFKSTQSGASVVNTDTMEEYHAEEGADSSKKASIPQDDVEDFIINPIESDNYINATFDMFCR